MAVRFNSSTDGYICDTDLAATGTFSMCCWGTWDTDRNDYSTWLALGGTGADSSFMLQTHDSGVAATVWYKGTEPMGTGGRVTMSQGLWYFLAVSVNGAAGNMYVRAHNATSTTVKSWTGGPTTMTPTNNTIGYNTAFATEWLNGRVAAAKIWNGVALTQAEFEAEMWQTIPARTENLIAWYPLHSPDTVDYSGNGRDLTMNGSVAQESGPPIPWESARILSRPYIFSSGGGATNANAGEVSATATAYGATVTTAASAAAGHASVSVDAEGATVATAVSAAAGHASASAAANGATTDLDNPFGDAGEVAASATAYGATVAVTGETTLRIFDTFDRADNPALGTVSSGGYTWADQNGPWLQISGNRLSTLATANNQSCIDVGSSDYDVSATVATVSGSARVGLVFRNVDAGNHWRLLRHIDGTAIVFRTTGAASDGFWFSSVPVNAGDVLRVVNSGSLIKCYVNGVESHSFDDPKHAEATKVGVTIIETGPELDNFSATPMFPMAVVTAYAPTVVTNDTLGEAGDVSASTSANAGTAALGAPSGHAPVSATAYDATVSTAINNASASAERAAVTVSADGPTPVVGGIAADASASVGAFDASVSTGVSAGHANVLSAAQSPTSASGGLAGAATAATAAYAPTVDLDDTLGAAGHAAIAGAASQPTAAVAAHAGHAAASVSSQDATVDADDTLGQVGNVNLTVSASQPTVSVGAQAGLATASTATEGASAAISAPAGASTATVTAGQPQVALGASAGHAAASAAAENASTEGVPDRQVSAGHASASATSNQPTAAVSALAGHASVSTAAENASVDTNADGSAGQADSTVTAHDPSANLAANAGTTAVSVVAYGATVSTVAETDAEAGQADSTATAYGASTVTSFATGSAAVSATAYDATVTSAAETDAPAGTATSTAAAYSASVQVSFTAGHASATAAAENAQAVLAAAADVVNAAATAYGATVQTSSAPTAGTATGAVTAYAVTAVISQSGDAETDAAPVSVTAYGPTLVINLTTPKHRTFIV